MKNKLILTVAALALAWLPQKALAAQPTIETSYLQGVPIGVLCSTGAVASQINVSSPALFTATMIAGYRIQNQSSYPVWIGGSNVSVSTAVTNADATQMANLGEKLNAGADAPWTLGRALRRADKDATPLYCRASDDAGAASALLSLVWYGY